MYKSHKCKYFRERIINLFEFVFWPFFSKFEIKKKGKKIRSPWATSLTWATMAIILNEATFRSIMQKQLEYLVE